MGMLTKSKNNSSSSNEHRSNFHIDKINPKVVQAQYAVRGAVVSAAMKLEERLASGEQFPFDSIVYCNIGNPQSLGQKPITYGRQVMAACNYPALAEESSTVLPDDVKARARAILAETPSGSIGAYTHSQGLKCIRDDVVSYLEQRDGFPASPNNIFLTDGASVGIKAVMQLLCSSETVGIMIPIPQYPLYSATIDMLGARQVHYDLKEDSNWSLNVQEMEKTLKESEAKGIETRALCVINPGNPTGAFLSEDSIKGLIELAKKHQLVLLADEVYQSNVYDESVAFHSFRKVLHNMGDEFASVELVSFHSTSKGLLGECGYRGGYMELTNISQTGHEQLYKLASISLCPNINGQIMTSLLCRPPVEGDASYELYKSELDALNQSLISRAELVSTALNEIEGISCNPVQGSMYAFVKIDMSADAMKAAEAQSLPADVFFALQMLEKTGICVVPGSGFGQEKGTFHFRTTILPQEDKIAEMMPRLRTFVAEFRSSNFGTNHISTL